ncbi:cysteine-rich secretory protein LCCL domain-containing 2-like [Stylophora pistillata]|uniref:cysteine-rich secretory protein LCCL domain-containing 2-like n=1 Tax=Stylophora pistillata TaxID=50429 RepID=UPI000C04D9D6|nr:cysteine-rich secretory protein LCCL domain-containing 2-like [Stylophora pistillata]
MAIEYAISRLSQSQQEQFVDEHNKFRSLVNPPAANMEYLFWNDDLGNLAQMWANKCTWDHGFLEFGELYPNAPFRGQVGQNLAREWTKLQNPADRVKLWYKESSNYTFNNFYTAMVPNHCSKPPCKRYTQNWCVMS